MSNDKIDNERALDAARDHFDVIAAAPLDYLSAEATRLSVALSDTTRDAQNRAMIAYALHLTATAIVARVADGELAAESW